MLNDIIPAGHSASCVVNGAVGRKHNAKAKYIPVKPCTEHAMFQAPNPTCRCASIIPPGISIHACEDKQPKAHGEIDRPRGETRLPRPNTHRCSVSPREKLLPYIAVVGTRCLLLSGVLATDPAQDRIHLIHRFLHSAIRLLIMLS
jgi:hypothetical protein